MRGTWIVLFVVAATAAWTANANAQAFSDTQVQTDGQTPTITLTRMVSSLPTGKVWATHKIQFGGAFAACNAPPDGVKGIEWTGATGPYRIDPYMKAAIAKELLAVGFKPGDDPDNLFQEKRGSTDLVLGGDIKDISAELCTKGQYVSVGSELRMARYLQNESTGSIKVKVSWQLYSNSRKKIVFSNEFDSKFSIDKHEAGNIQRLMQGGMEASVHDLILSPAFQEAVKANSTKETLQAVALQPIAFSAPKAAGATKMSDAVGSVVLIQSGGGHGSGFLVSSDGYVLTAEHVVGADKFVKIRWSDGLEGVGEVVRSNKRRDVAIIKTDPRGRQPLAMHRATPEPGDTVFAIGSPLDVKFQSTVTRGVASANRILDGFAFIQSDVTISPGNSGGPLLNEKGEVLGICDLTFRPGGADVPSGINYFVPIDDALRFLSAEPK